MGGTEVSVERIRFDEYHAEIEELLTTYHQWVADGFDDHLSRSGMEDGFSSEAYVRGELEKDLTYLGGTTGERPLVVALDGNSVVGCVYLYALSDNEAEIKRLFVSEAYRGLGLGRKLVTAIIEYATELGYTSLRLDSTPFMQSAQDLYEDLGFEPYEGGESVSNLPEGMLSEITYMKRGLDDE